MEQKNNRMKVINEVFMNIKLIKMNAWEEFFYKKIMKRRKDENICQKKKVVTRIGLLFFLWMTPNAIVFAVLGSYMLLGGAITATKAFTVVATFMIL